MKRLFLILSFVSFCFGKHIDPMDFGYLKNRMPKLHPSLLDIHLKLYAGYVAQVNYIDSQLKEEEDLFSLQSLRKQYGFEFDGMRLHELYFEQLGGNGKTNSAKKVVSKIFEYYKTLDLFKEKVKSYAKTRGIGWVILFTNPLNGELKLCWIADHEKGFLVDYRPVFVIDLWEHAYISQFGLDKDEYVNLMFEYTDWDVVNQRYLKNFITQKKTIYKKVRK